MIQVEVPYGEVCPNKNTKVNYDVCKECGRYKSLSKTFVTCHLNNQTLYMTQEERDIIADNCPHWNECAYPCKNCPTFKKMFNHDTRREELLLKDLCNRLTSHTILQVYYEEMSDCGTFDEELWDVDVDTPTVNGRWVKWVKPYLRPMSSMTEEEKNEWMEITHAQEWLIIGNLDKAIDWLNAHHFDYRGLIPMGFALEAPEGMYNL